MLYMKHYNNTQPNLIMRYIFTLFCPLPYVHMHACTCVCIHACMYAYMHVCTHTRTHTHTHTQSHKPLAFLSLHHPFSNSHQSASKDVGIHQDRITGLLQHGSQLQLVLGAMDRVGAPQINSANRLWPRTCQRHSG